MEVAVQLSRNWKPARVEGLPEVRACAGCCCCFFWGCWLLAAAAAGACCC
jgi:hypothetical protein